MASFRHFTKFFGVWVVGLCRLASAQEFGLDLSQLQDVRPTAAFIGISAVDALPEGTWTSLKMDRVTKNVFKTLQASDIFSKISGTGQAFDALGALYSQSFSCAQEDCLEALALKMRVNVVLLGQLKVDSEKVFLRVLSYTRFGGETRSVDVFPTRNPTLFERKVRDAFLMSAKKANLPMGLLKLVSNTPNAEALFGPWSLGRLPVEQPVPVGIHPVIVRSEGFLEDVLEVNIEPGGVVSLEANLVPQMELPAPSAKENEFVETFDEARKPRRSAALWKKPGTYLMMAGIASMAVGAAFGYSAQRMQARAVDADNDGTLDITRRQALAAQNDALWANVLLGAGGVATAGGLLWLSVAPAHSRHGSSVSVTLSGEFP